MYLQIDFQNTDSCVSQCFKIPGDCVYCIILLHLGNPCLLVGLKARCPLLGLQLSFLSYESTTGLVWWRLRGWQGTFPSFTTGQIQVEVQYLVQQLNTFRKFTQKATDWNKLSILCFLYKQPRKDWTSLGHSDLSLSSVSSLILLTYIDWISHTHAIIPKGCNIKPVIARDLKWDLIQL